MLDVTVFRSAARSRYAPRQSGGGDQHLAGGRAGSAHRIPGGADAGAATGGLITEERAGSRLFNFDLLPVGLEFFGENHGKCSAYALTHLGARDHDGHFVVGSDSQIGVGRKRFLAGFIAMRQIEADDQSSAGGYSGSHKFAAGKWAHRAPPSPAAR